MAKRRVGKASGNRLSLAALAAWKAGDEAALHRALELPPWAPSPLQVAGHCPWAAGTAGALTWARSVELRSALEAAGE